MSHSYAVHQPSLIHCGGGGGGGQWHSERGRTVFEGEVVFVVFLNIL